MLLTSKLIPSKHIWIMLLQEFKLFFWSSSLASLTLLRASHVVNDGRREEPTSGLSHHVLLLLWPIHHHGMWRREHVVRIGRRHAIVLRRRRWVEHLWVREAHRLLLRHLRVRKTHGLLLRHLRIHVTKWILLGSCWRIRWRHLRSLGKVLLRLVLWLLRFDELHDEFRLLLMQLS